MYLLETGFFVNRNKFIEEAYQNAEKQIREAALNSGILEQTKANAGLILAPIFRELTEKTVVIRYDPGDIEIDREWKGVLFSCRAVRKTADQIENRDLKPIFRKLLFSYYIL